MFAIAVGVLIGIGLPLQTSINSRLRAFLGSPFRASLISFAIGTAFLAVITLVSQGSLLFAGQLFTTQPWWLWSGGLLGVVYLTGNILLFPKLGSVQTVIFPIFGQILAGLLIDNFAWFGARHIVLTPLRVGGALLVLVGVIGTVAITDLIDRHHNRLEPTPSRPDASLWLWRLAGVLTGMGSAVQTTVNGRLGVVLGSKVQAAFVSFLVGTLALAVIALVTRHLPRETTQQANTWWLWLGGMIGALYVFGNVYLAVALGTGLAVVIVLIGLMVGSLLIDQFGWLGTTRKPIDRLQLVSLLVMAAGVALIRLF